MNSFKFNLFHLFVAGVAVLGQNLCAAKVIMEYIGATGAPVTFDSVPIEDKIDFHFILGFAIDANLGGKSQNGKFSPYWTNTLTKESILAIKKRYRKVKVLASIAGWSIGKKVLRWYNPKEPEKWISNAFNSIKSMVETYHLDGIDVDYENFPRRNVTFAYCVGELISLLKNRSVISVATIAPYYDTADTYVGLFQKYGSVIDYVNYQFYTDKITKPASYLDAFRLRSGQFDKNKLLPSYEVNGRGIQGDAFFDSLDLLQKSGFDVNGVMIFLADTSSSSKYSIEKKSQAFLLNSTRVS